MKDFFMKNKARLFGIYLPIFVLALLSTVTLRTLALLFDFNIKSGYFDDKLMINAANALLVGTVIFMLTYAFTAKKNMRLIASFSSLTSYIPSALTIGALLFLSAYLLRIFFAILTSMQGYPGSILSISYYVTNLFVTGPCAVLAICAAVHFALTVLFEQRYNHTRANFGIVTVIFFAVYTAYLYFDTSLPLNSPNKIIDEMAILMLAVFFLFETRLSIGREKWKLYITSGFITALLCAYSSIPSIIYYIVEKKTLSNNVYENLLVLALFFFVVTKTLLTGELTEDKVSPKAQLIMDAAKRRDDEIIENAHAAKTVEEQTEQADENQISISDIAEGELTDEEIAEQELIEQQKQELLQQIDELSTQEDG